MLAVAPLEPAGPCLAQLSVRRVPGPATPDLRKFAEPLAIAAPIAIAFGNVASETVMSLVAILFLAHSVQTRDFAWARQPAFAAYLALWAYSVLRAFGPAVSLDGIGVAFAWIRFILFAAALATWLLPNETVRNLSLIHI